jgi:hypothetical protein
MTATAAIEGRRQLRPAHEHPATPPDQILDWAAIATKAMKSNAMTLQILCGPARDDQLYTALQSTHDVHMRLMELLTDLCSTVAEAVS